MFNIMIVEDDVNQRKLMSTVLSQYGYTALCAGDGIEALDLLDKKHVDLIILDIMMPRMDGFEFTDTLRKSGCNIPILMVSAKQSPVDKRRGFIIGTDDYMTKPVDEEEMVLRVGALLRRSKIASERKLTVGDTTLYYDSFTVETPEGTQELPQKEFLLLYKVLSFPNKSFTRIQLMDEIWGLDCETGSETVTVHVGRLRKRFEHWDDFEIEAIRGLGYKAVKKV